MRHNTVTLDFFKQYHISVMPFTDQELEALRAKLPRGSAKRLAEQLGYAHGSVRNILSGKAKNDVVIIAAHKLIKDLEGAVSEAKADLAS